MVKTPKIHCPSCNQHRRGVTSATHQLCFYCMDALGSLRDHYAKLIRHAIMLKDRGYRYHNPHSRPNIASFNKHQKRRRLGGRRAPKRGLLDYRHARIQKILKGDDDGPR